MTNRATTRKVKESVLLRLDLTCAHEEMRPLREPFERSFGAPDCKPEDAFLDWFALDCPEEAEQMRAVPREKIASALAAWRNGRGQRARKSNLAPKKMDAVVKLLAALDIACTAASLAVLWSQLVAKDRAPWRGSGSAWFRAWGAKRAASARN